MRCWLVVAAMGSAISPLQAADALFRAHVAPIFEKHCLSCHGGGEPKGGLSIESAKQFAAGGDSGPAIVNGKPEESLLIELIGGDVPQMPKDAKPLAADEVARIRQWVAAGAEWPVGYTLTDKKTYDFGWWSLRSIVRPAPPSIKTEWIRTPIDAFILAKLKEQELAPSPEADRRTLVRRLYFDLLGLPPSFQEVQEFVADGDPESYEKLVDRLLTLPQYGERWGRHWLDVVHYGDTHGYDKDKLRENAWPYRDYVIRAFNEGKSYTRFVEEQVAGDVLYPDSIDGVTATGFVAAGPFDFVGQIEVAEGTLAKAVTRNLDRDDMVATTLGAFNSMTAQCARCHNHKFDPITQEDYYGLQAVFAGVDRADRPFKYFVDGQERTGLVFAAATDFPARNQFTPTRGKPRSIHVLKRGNENEPGAEAAAGACGYFAELGSRFNISVDAGEGARRVALARWLTDKRNALTWRSIVNRVWQYHFGRGIVDSSNDFGRMGALPSHPELLDWLAAEFRDGSQSIKSLHRLICTSAVYRQSSAGNAKFEATDGGNQYLWRMNRRKLEAEAVRDSVLCVAGRLDLTAGGPGFRDFSFQDDESPRYKYDEYDPEESQTHRRSVYRVIVRSVPNPWMTALDCADASAVVAKRNETLTPLQSLALLNNKFMVRMAEHFANRVSDLGQNSPTRIAAAFRIAFAREPDQEELKALTAYANNYGLPNVCRVIINMNEFVFVD